MSNTLKGQVTVRLGDEDVSLQFNLSAYRLACESGGFGVRNDSYTQFEAFLKENPTEYLLLLLYGAYRQHKLVTEHKDAEISYKVFCALYLDDIVEGREEIEKAMENASSLGKSTGSADKATKGK